MESLAEAAKRSLFWSFLERVGTVGFQFLIQLLLARLLVPEDYGLCAILLAFINISTVFVDSGLPSALIQKEKVERIDYSSAFYLTFFASVVIYIVLFVLSPFVASFFGNDILCPALRILSISLVIGAFNSVQIAYLKRNFQFRKQFVANLSAIIFSAIVSIALALQGFGVWSIIWQYLSYRLISTLMLFIQVRWYPYVEFSRTRVLSLLSFGWKCMASNILSIIITDIYTVIIGKFFTKENLGVYDTGSKIPLAISTTVTSTLNSVTFPVFSRLQNDGAKLKDYIHKSNSISSFIVFPVMFGIAAMAEPLVRVLLTDKWIDAVPFLQIACVLYAFYPIHANNLQAINALGRSDIGLKLEVVKKTLDILFLLLFLPCGLIYVAFGRMLTSILGLWINIFPNKKLVGYSFKEQLLDIIPTFLIAGVSAIIMYLIPQFISVSDIVMVLIQCLFGLSLYCVLSHIFNKATLQKVVQIIKLKRKHSK